VLVMFRSQFIQQTGTVSANLAAIGLLLMGNSTSVFAQTANLTSARLPSGEIEADATDFFVGTWKLDVATYRNSSRSTWKSRTINVQNTSSGYHVSMNGVHGDGSPLRFTFDAITNGADYPVRQTAGKLYLDAIALTKGRNGPKEIVFKKHGTLVETNQVTFSSDGQQMILSTNGVANGKQFTSSSTYKKTKDAFKQVPDPSF